MAEGRELGGRPHGPRDKARLLRSAVFICDLTCQFRCTFVENESLILKVVFRQHHGRCTEGVGLDHITTSLQKLAMHSLNRVRTSDDEVFVATLENFTTEIRRREIHLLQRCTRGTVEHQHRPTGIVQTLEEARRFSDGLRLNCLHHHWIGQAILRNAGLRSPLLVPWIQTVAGLALQFNSGDPVGVLLVAPLGDGNQLGSKRFHQRSLL